MPKYVCDIEQVYSIGEKVCQVAQDINSSVTNYSSRIDSYLSTWTGTAKDAFTKTNATQVQTATEDTTYINELGDFIKEASRKIQELEEQLAGLSI